MCLFIYLIINDLLKLLIHGGFKNINFCRVFGWTSEHLYCKTFFVSLNAPLLVITGVKKFKICTNSHEFTGILHLHVSVQKYSFSPGFRVYSIVLYSYRPEFSSIVPAGSQSYRFDSCNPNINKKNYSFNN